MKNYLIELSYDGSGYIGYQIQPRGNTIQKELEYSLKRLFNQRIVTFVAGRTDKGVHAYGQKVNFKVNTPINIEDILVFVNRSLNKDIRVISIKEVDINFHARFSAISREYVYKIRFDVTPFNSRYFSFYKDFDIDLFKKAMMKFVGIHDFKYFSSKTKEESIREIYSINFDEHDGIDVYIKGKSFLRSMIRSMVGTSLDIAKGKKNISFIDKAFKDHSLGKRNIAMPNGLYFLNAEY